MIDCIKKRRTVRLFDPNKEVELEKIKEILECAHLAPSAKNLQPWYFVVIKNKDLIQKITNCPMGDKPEGCSMLEDEDERFKANTPKVMIAVFFDKTKSIMADEKYYKNAQVTSGLVESMSYSDIISIGTCIQNMHLASEALGIGACITGEFLDVEDSIGEKLYKMLSVDPKKYSLMGGIRFGYPHEKCYRHYERNPIKKHYHIID